VRTKIFDLFFFRFGESFREQKNIS
jgi:hypothetical protein